MYTWYKTTRPLAAVRQRAATLLLPVISPNADKFSNFFNIRLSRKFETKSSLKMSCTTLSSGMFGTFLTNSSHWPGSFVPCCPPVCESWQYGNIWWLNVNYMRMEMCETHCWLSVTSAAIMHTAVTWIWPSRILWQEKKKKDCLLSGPNLC